MTTGRLSACLLALLLAAPAARAGGPSYAKQVQPFFNKYCVECHNSDRPRAGLNLENYKGLEQGSDNGKVLVPGRADESPVVLLAEGKKEPRMPPKKAEAHPQPAEVALLRAWVAAGARDDGVIKVVLPQIKSRARPAAPVTALAYLPDGRLLAGAGDSVIVIDTEAGRAAGRLDAPGGVTALACSGDGSRAAVATGTPGAPSSLEIYAVPAAGRPWAKPLARVGPAHGDVIQDLKFSPDGRRLITAGYDKKVKIWDAATGAEVKTLTEHSDSVFGAAYQPGGALFATAAADRAVKVWRAGEGKLLYTLGESTDWVYAAAFSPDGKHLAAAGVDRSIRVWQVGADEGQVVHSVFAHESPIVRLVYSPDGQTLYSAGEDNIVKAWDAARMVERRVYPPQPEAILALAVRPDGEQLAVGRYDGALVLLDAATGKVQAQPLPGQADPDKVNRRPTAGEEQYTALADEARAVAEREGNNSPGGGQLVGLPAAVDGVIEKAGDLDYFRFEAKAGQQVGAKVVVPKVNGKPAADPVLYLTDAAGRVLAQGRAEGEQRFLGFTAPRDGAYAVGVRDRDFGGGPAMKYRLELGDLPVVTSVFPLGLQAGTKARVRVTGVHLGGAAEVEVDAAAAKPGDRLAVNVAAPGGRPLGSHQVVVGEFPEVSEGNPAAVPVPGTANGVIAAPGETDLWRFAAKKGERLVIEVHAERLGSDLDPYIEVLDAAGRPVPQATLRPAAQTFVTFRDHNSQQGNIRIEAWSELAMNDYIYVGTELICIRDLPTHPDADCNFVTVRGQRRGYLGTTPTHLSNGLPMYKVTIHPPGTEFPPNGFPVVTLFYRNEDGGPGFGRDSRLVFDPPADGEYAVRVGDTEGGGGPGHSYRLTVRPPRPDFTVRAAPASPSVWKGGSVPLTVTADRIDEYDGPIALKFDNVPPGFSIPDTSIPAGEESTTVAVWADADARTPDKAPPLQVVATAEIDGRTVTRTAGAGVPKAVEPGDIVATTDRAEVAIRPGGRARLTVRIERRNGFAGRVPINVQGLPHGVKVLDIGLNGILITERETARTMVLSCEPWVEPIDHPIVISARREGPNTDHGAQSVLLRVE